MSIHLEPQLQTKLDQTAQRLGKSVEEIAADAIRTHLEELDTQALDEEERAYQRLYPELRHRYLQQYVAIYEGRVIDSDPDFEELFVRVKKQFEDRIVLLRKVGNNATEEYYFRNSELRHPFSGISL